MTGVVRVAAAVIDAEACALWWPYLRRWLDDHRKAGGAVRPQMIEAAEAIRLAAVEYTSFVNANDHRQRSSADIEASCAVRAQTLVSTADLAAALRLSPCQTRRVAKAAGVTALGRGVWTREDVDAVLAWRAATERKSA